ncbi:cupin domain-containing protein [Streptomyces sp. NPDC127039]|uniref:cupin domain-containing protein n=1 Tax=Streptomyces sp. NPDC127039 TaxID=3347115 RepID=UPI00365D802A
MSRIATPQTGTDAVPPSSLVGTILPGVLLIEDYEGKSAIEHVMPRTPDGAEAAPVRTSWWSVEPGCTSFPDRHAVQELWLIAAGSGRMSLGDQSLDVRAGQVVFIPSQEPHTVTATGPDALEAYSIWW